MRPASKPSARRARNVGGRAPSDALFPRSIVDEAELDGFLTRPRPGLIQSVKTVSGRLLVLGAGGKMGPTLAVLARRAADLARHKLEIVAVSRFGDQSTRDWLEGHGVRTIQADLLDPKAYDKLPDSSFVAYLVGLKFGTRENPSLTWAVNTLVPAYVMKRYSAARVVALSTGNVYPMVSARSRGARESDPLTPLGEYANAAVARERLFEYFCQKNGTRVALLRLNYAVELRYGVLVDIAAKVLAGQPVALANGYFNCIWQGDANDMILRSFALTGCPATAWNLTSLSKLNVRAMAMQFGRIFGVKPRFVGREQSTALLSDSSRLWKALGEAPTPLNAVIEWTANWVSRGGRSLNKATHFEVRDGRY